MTRFALLFLVLISVVPNAFAQNSSTPQGVRGSISSIDRDRKAVRLRVAEGEYVTVEVHSRTAFRHDRGEALTFADLRVGDVVAAVGEQRERFFLADELRVMSGTPEEAPARRTPEARAADVIEGTVRKPTRTITRKLGIRTERENLSVEVPKDAVILKDDKRISVHELASGDRVRLQGRWDDQQRFRVERIAVASKEDGSFPEAAVEDRRPGVPGTRIEGTVLSHDAARTRLRIGSGRREYVVQTGAARIVLGTRVVGRSQIRQGDRVVATGRLRGTELVAERIEIR